MDAPYDNPPAAATRVGFVMAAVRSRIDARAIGRGAKLPSVRKFAEQLGVSKSTVVEAYDRLAAEGLVEARRGSGFYVASASPPLVLAAAPPSLNPGIDLLAIMRNALESRPDMLQPGAGWLPESWLPLESVERALRAVSRGPAAAKLRYDPPRGLEPLRRVIAARLTERGAPVDPAQILLTDSATHGLDLAARFFLSPGDCVVIDDPHYFNIVQLLDVHRAKIVLAPFLPDGPDLAALESVFAEHRPRLYLTVAGPHNPTGAVWSPSHAHRALKLAERYDVVIVEDDIYCDLEPTPSPRLASFDGYDRVVQVGGFSKTVSAALRTGYIVARPDWAAALVDLKLATSLGNSSLAANILHRVLTEGSYRRYLDASAPASGRGDRAHEPTAEKPRRDALDRAARRHVSLGAASRRTGRRRSGESRTGGECRVRAGSRVQSEPAMARLHAFQCRVERGAARVRIAGSRDEAREVGVTRRQRSAA